MKKQIFMATMALSVLAGCSSIHNHEHSAGDAHHHKNDNFRAEIPHNDDIVFTVKQAEAAGLQTEIIIAAPFNEIIKTSGVIQIPQGDEVIIAATSSGIVSFVDLSLTDGRTVRAGESLATISSKNFPDGDPTQKARIEFDAAQIEYERAEALVEDQIISAKEFEEARLRYQNAKAVYEAQSDNITIGGIKVTVPINGYIRSIFITQGEYVSVGQPIAAITQNRKLQLRAEVSEKYFKSIRSIVSANFRMAYDSRLYKLTELNGRLLSYGRSSDGSFYLPVTFEFDNISDIIPGAFTEVYLLGSRIENVLSIPKAALTEEQGIFFVYIRTGEEDYVKREVAIGPEDGERVLIISGLYEGEEVVTRGAVQIKLAAVSSVMPEGHTH